MTWISIKSAKASGTMIILIRSVFILLFYPVKINHHYQIGLLLENISCLWCSLKVPGDGPSEDQEQWYHMEAKYIALYHD